MTILSAKTRREVLDALLHAANELHQLATGAMTRDRILRIRQVEREARLAVKLLGK